MNWIPFRPIGGAALIAMLAIPAVIQAQPAAGGRGAATATYTNAQLNAITAMEMATAPKNAAVTAARTALVAAAFASVPDRADFAVKAAALAAAEQSLAMARADAFAGLQASAERLSAAQVTSMAATMGRGGRAGAAASEAIDFGDHTGYVSLFDGTLSGWDVNPDAWHIVDGAITADTVATPGATFAFWKGGTVRDFELRLQVKLTGPSPGSGIQYRSRRNNDQYAIASVSGYQFDLGGRNYGQLVDQGGRSIITYPGESAIDLPTRHIRIGDLGGALVFDSVRQGDWNQVDIIARGNTLIHILNGRVFSVSVDEDPSRIQEGVIALQAEGMGQIAFKEIWLKRL